MPNIRLVSFFWLLLLVSACKGWPPYETKARKHFAENIESFERLAEKMRSTDFWRVSIHGQSGVKVTPRADGVYEDQFIIDHDPEWRELLVSVGMFMVLQQDGAVWTDSGSGMWGDKENQMGHSGFTHDPNLLDEFKICQPDYEDIPCGRCAVPLGDDWFIHYRWYPEYFSKAKWDSYLEGGISLEEYSESRDKANRQCHIDGYTEIGYDLDRILNLEES